MEKALLLRMIFGGEPLLADASSSLLLAAFSCACACLCVIRVRSMCLPLYAMHAQVPEHVKQSLITLITHRQQHPCPSAITMYEVYSVGREESNPANHGTYHSTVDCDIMIQELWSTPVPENWLRGIGWSCARPRAITILFGK